VWSRRRRRSSCSTRSTSSRSRRPSAVPPSTARPSSDHTPRDGSPRRRREPPSRRRSRGRGRGRARDADLSPRRGGRGDLPKVKDAAQRACVDPNITVRDHAMRALRALGAPDATCPMPPPPADGAASPVSSPPLAHPTRVTFDIDGAKLPIVFEPDLSPVAASRFVALAKAGFYRGIVVHRVVPGTSCSSATRGATATAGRETSSGARPRPCVRPAGRRGRARGRDTGSSQIFRDPCPLSEARWRLRARRPRGGGLGGGRGGGRGER